MLEFNTLKFKDIQLAKSIVLDKGSNLNPFYSLTRKSITYFAIIKGVYIATKDKKKIGILVIDSGLKEFYFYPSYRESKYIRFSDFIDSLYERFELSGYTFNFACNNYNYIKGSENKYDIVSSVKFMSYDLEKSIEKIREKAFKNKNLSIRNYRLKKDEEIRVNLQNQIFKEVEGREDLTLKDVMIEEYSPKFIEELCFILEEQKRPIGYGQIININEDYFLVNFGIIPEYRKKGYGKQFLNYILLNAYENDIETVELTVDNYNKSAVRLYSSEGFIETKNTLKIKL